MFMFLCRYVLIYLCVCFHTHTLHTNMLMTLGLQLLTSFFFCNLQECSWCVYTQLSLEEKTFFSFPIRYFLHITSWTRVRLLPLFSAGILSDLDLCPAQDLDLLIIVSSSSFVYQSRCDQKIEFPQTNPPRFSD